MLHYDNTSIMIQDLLGGFNSESCYGCWTPMSSFDNKVVSSPLRWSFKVSASGKFRKMRYRDVALMLYKLVNFPSNLSNCCNFHGRNIVLFPSRLTSSMCIFRYPSNKIVYYYIYSNNLWYNSMMYSSIQIVATSMHTIACIGNNSTSIRVCTCKNKHQVAGKCKSLVGRTFSK